MNQPQPQQNIDIPINSPYDNLTAEQKYENLIKGTADLFNTRTQETEDRTIPQFSTSIISGTSFWQAKIINSLISHNEHFEPLLYDKISNKKVQLINST